MMLYAQNPDKAGQRQRHQQYHPIPQKDQERNSRKYSRHNPHTSNMPNETFDAISAIATFTCKNYSSHLTVDLHHNE
jgi:hypothetical protein